MAMLTLRRFVFWITAFTLFAVATIVIAPLFGAEPVRPW